MVLLEDTYPVLPTQETDDPGEYSITGITFNNYQNGLTTYELDCQGEKSIKAYMTLDSNSAIKLHSMFDFANHHQDVVHLTNCRFATDSKSRLRLHKAHAETKIK